MNSQDTPEAHYARGGALFAQRRLEAALAAFDLAVARQPGFARAWNDRGVVLREMGRPDEAIASIRRAITLAPGYAEAFFNRATVLGLDKKDHAAAIADVRHALSLAPGLPYARGLLLHCLLQSCDWRDFARQVAAVEDLTRAGAEASEPFVLQAVSHSPADLRLSAEIYGRRTPTMGTLWRPRRQQRLRLGYVAGEFRHHATAMLTARLFELHDRERFEVIALDSGGGDDSAMRARLEASFDRWIDIRSLDDDAAAAAIADAEIDILVNLNGYVGEDRMGVFARRPAPVQVNWLGFPGTLGAPYIDYIVADPIVIPPDETVHYTEQVAWLPHTYQANDDRRGIADEDFTRAGCGLPSDGFVFCNFNSAHKFTPEAFDAWMRILAAVPGSVLWLLAANPAATANLKTAARARGVAPQRLVFAPNLPLEQHLARLKLAGLFLDTFPYNAHTTASDALWAGVPVLTVHGDTFAGRVAESLLRAVGLPELVAPGVEAFEAEALALAREPLRLQALREKLAANRTAAPLFDSLRFTRDLETAYQTMWEIHLSGAPPRSFLVQDA